MPDIYMLIALPYPFSTLLHTVLCSGRLTDLYGPCQWSPLPSGFQLGLANWEPLQEMRGNEKSEERGFIPKTVPGDLVPSVLLDRRTLSSQGGTFFSYLLPCLSPTFAFIFNPFIIPSSNYPNLSMPSVSS